MSDAPPDSSDVRTASPDASARSNQRGTTRADRYPRNTVRYSVIASPANAAFYKTLGSAYCGTG